MSKDIASLEAELQRVSRQVPMLSHWRHVKSDVWYVIDTCVIIEATQEVAVVYRSRDERPALPWCRPADEFLDGRFEKCAQP